ncbi:LytTR family DNA-binding domain-containing protein [Lactobacillaceae bacterium Melli_B4]
MLLTNRKRACNIKINFFIDTEQPEHVDFYLNELDDQIRSLAEQIQHISDGQILGYRENTIKPLDVNHIIRFITDEGKVQIQTDDSNYHTKERIYQWAKQLPNQFIQISSSEIINFDFVDHLELSKNGNIKLVLKNKTDSFVARRYLHLIKERLGI